MRRTKLDATIPTQTIFIIHAVSCPLVPLLALLIDVNLNYKYFMYKSNIGQYFDKMVNHVGLKNW